MVTTITRLFVLATLIIVALCLLAFSPASAGTVKKAEVHKTAGMTVKARQIEERLSAELANYGHPVTVITAQQIKEGGYTEIFQMLEALVPGLFISMKAGPGDYANYSLHGSKEILWLLDGVRINNRLYSKGYLDTISPNMIDRIEVLYGGEGLFYGTEAASGVVNIITKPVSKKLEMEFGAGYGQYQHRNLYGYVTDTVAGNGFMVWGSNDGWKGYQPFSDQTLARVGNSRHETRSYNRTNLGVKYRREFNVAGCGLLRFQYQRNLNPADYCRPNEQFALNDRIENIAILKWDHDVNHNFSYYIKAYYHDWWTKYTRRRLDGTYIFDEALWGYQDWGVNAMASYRFGGGHELLFGVDYQNYFGDDEVVLIKGEHEEVWAGFVNYRPYLSFAPFLKPALGLRYNKTKGSDKLIWNASIRGDFSHGVYARAVAGTSFILPNAWQLYADEENYVGNPNLKPEESTNLDLGLGIKQGRFFAEAGYFYQEIKDLIARKPTGGPREIFDNVGGKSEFKGFTLTAGVGPFHGFSLKASYTNVEATRGDTGEQMDDTPKYFWKAILSWRQGVDSGLLGADLTGRYVGEIKKYNTNYGNYWLADLSMFYRFGKDHQHQFTLRVENLFDEDYYSRLGRTKDTSGARFIYGYKGIPFNAMLSYDFFF